MANKTDNKTIIGLLVVAGVLLFLVGSFTGHGVFSKFIGGKGFVPFTPEEITISTEEGLTMAQKQGVLNMLNECSLKTGFTSDTMTPISSCDEQCSSLNKVCTLAIVNLREASSGDLHSKLQTCSLNFRQGYPDQYYSCYCCKP